MTLILPGNWPILPGRTQWSSNFTGPRLSIGESYCNWEKRREIRPPQFIGKSTVYSIAGNTFLWLDHYALLCTIMHYYHKSLSHVMKCIFLIKTQTNFQQNDEKTFTPNPWKWVHRIQCYNYITRQWAMAGLHTSSLIMIIKSATSVLCRPSDDIRNGCKPISIYK